MRCLFVFSIFILSFFVYPVSAGANIKYYGYDWLDYYESANPSFSATDAYNSIYDAGYSTTNLNVVHSIKSLGLPICADGKCALNIQAGSGSTTGSPLVDICPGATSNNACQAAGSWLNIWKIIQDVANAPNKPSAIYFIDEPFDVPAMQTNSSYDAYQYASYVCTVRQAMKNYGVSIPIYTILSYRHSQIPSYLNEIQNGAPTTACPAADKSTPDWVGVDNYNWSVSDMWETYNRVAPQNNVDSPKWVLVPPSTASLGLNDEKLSAQIKLYRNFINQYPNAPVIYIMNWRFDKGVTEKRSVYTKSTALLSCMANSIVLKLN
ncbi:hypothetical protein FHU10_4736 [Serratia fonticola]|uniref:GH26 domain-containing protein n=1 Tax=Serratia fonticola TaxID=47917 RepID=A0A559TBT9_SERFO|nr:hypothetical protein [Serratia fonticola]TQI80399.1 hypothetical protein FHU09_2969 [Serratia fonticola]TQI97575.1 hypothetical protein FHU11_3076 [Serratia fonticola]TVZ72073.1 hypothetical protein FHU10_4736 [Serratia fonticola]